MDHIAKQIVHNSDTRLVPCPSLKTGGYIDLMKGPGLGIEVDEEQVRRLSKGTKPWVSPGFIGPGGEVREW